MLSLKRYRAGGLLLSFCQGLLQRSAWDMGFQANTYRVRTKMCLCKCWSAHVFRKGRVSLHLSIGMSHACAAGKLCTMLRPGMLANTPFSEILWCSVVMRHEKAAAHNSDHKWVGCCSGCRRLAASSVHSISNYHFEPRQPSASHPRPGILGLSANSRRLQCWHA